MTRRIAPPGAGPAPRVCGAEGRARHKIGRQNLPNARRPFNGLDPDRTLVLRVERGVLYVGRDAGPRLGQWLRHGCAREQSDGSFRVLLSRDDAHAIASGLAALATDSCGFPIAKYVTSFREGQA